MNPGIALFPQSGSDQQAFPPWSRRNRSRTVVGVVGDVKNFETIDVTEPQVYVPFVQQPRRTMTVVLAVPRGSGTYWPATARGAVAAIDPTEPIVDMASMDDRIHRVNRSLSNDFHVRRVLWRRYAAPCWSGRLRSDRNSFAQRTREIGIRMALGARRADVAGSALKQIRTFLLAGLLPGLALGAGSRPRGQSDVGRRHPYRLAVYLSMTLLLAIAALLGALVPTRRAIAIIE